MPEIHFPHEDLAAVTFADVDVGVDDLLIGRLPECDVCIAHPRVSKKHAWLRRTATGWLLVDADSANKTAVDGQPCDVDRPLYDGSVIAFGQLRAHFYAPHFSRPQTRTEPVAAVSPRVEEQEPDAAMSSDELVWRSRETVVAQRRRDRRVNEWSRVLWLCVMILLVFFGVVLYRDYERIQTRATPVRANP